MELLSGFLVVPLGQGAIIGYLVMQPLALRRWSGGWRIAALVPPLATAPLLIQAILAASAGSNLWPLLLIYFVPVALLYLLAVGAIRWLAEQRPLLPQ